MWGCSNKTYSGTLKTEFHMIFTFHEMLLFFCVFNHLIFLNRLLLTGRMKTGSRLRLVGGRGMVLKEVCGEVGGRAGTSYVIRGPHETTSRERE